MQATDTPQKRPDLALTPNTEAGRTVTVVHNPVSGRYFRIREVEGFILDQLDGRTSLEEVHAALLREFPGVRLSLETLLKFVDRLADMGWLVGSTDGVAPRAQLPFYYRVLRAKLPPIPVDPLFQRMQPLVRTLYTPLALTAIVLFTLAVGYWAFFSWDDFVRYPFHIGSLPAWGLIWVAITCISVVHEFGHGLTCRYFGAKSDGIGFFLLYGIPCFYCDVSGAWTLSSRRQRILIGLAGLAYQFVAGAVAFVIWKLLEPDTVVARACQVMIGTCGLTALLNLNPLIKLDGYYLLSDWLRVPNLRQKALLYFRQRVASVVWGSKRPTLGDPRERRIFFWFGLVSSIYSFVLIWFLVTRLARWLLGTYHGDGALLLGVFAMAILVSWVRNLLKAARARVTQKREQPRRLNLRPLLFFGVLGLLGYAFWTAKMPFFIASPCTLEAQERVPVRPDVDGVLQEIRYREGDRVHAGSTLAVLQTYDLQKTTQQLRQRIAAVQAAGNAIDNQVPLVQAEKQRDVVEAEQEVRNALNDLQDQETQYPIRRAEAEKKVREAREALTAADRIADRLRTDERSAANGELTPAMQAVAEKIARVQAQRALAEKEVQRAAYLVKEGALQRQKLDSARTELQSLGRDEASLRSELEDQKKRLAEDREDAEAGVRRLTAAYDAAVDAQRLVEQETRPEKITAARQELQARERMLQSTAQLQKASAVKHSEAAAKRMEAQPLVTEVERVAKKIREATVKVPIDGIISSQRLEEKIGKEYDRGETIAWIDRIETLKARILVDEKDIAEVRKGLAVQLRVGAFPDRMFEGKVLEVSPRPVAEKGRSAYEVRILVDNPAGDLRPGISGYAKLIAGERPMREVAFRKLHRYIRTEAWTWWPW